MQLLCTHLAILAQTISSTRACLYVRVSAWTRTGHQQKLVLQIDRAALCLIHPSANSVHFSSKNCKVVYWESICPEDEKEREMPSRPAAVIRRIMKKHDPLTSVALTDFEAEEPEQKFSHSNFSE